LLKTSTFMPMVFLCNELLLITQVDFIGVGPGNQIAVGTGEFEDIKCGYTQETILNKVFFFCKKSYHLAQNLFFCDIITKRSEYLLITLPLAGLFVGWFLRALVTNQYR